MRVTSQGRGEVRGGKDYNKTGCGCGSCNVVVEDIDFSVIYTSHNEM